VNNLTFSSEIKKTPLKQGDQYKVKITSEENGKGTVKIKEHTVYVNNTKKGDKVKIVITDVAREKANGKVILSTEGLTEDGLSEEVAELEEREGDLI